MRVITVLLMTCILVALGCSKKDKEIKTNNDLLIGKWNGVSYGWELNNDGIYQYGEADNPYLREVYIKFDADGNGEDKNESGSISSITWSLNDNTKLTINAGSVSYLAEIVSINNSQLTLKTTFGSNVRYVIYSRQ